MDRNRLILLGLVGLTGLVALIVLATQVASPRMGVLYTGLDPAEAGEVVSAVEAMDVPVEIGGDNSTIMVPADRVGRVRMALAEQGLPTSGGIGYELFDKQGSLGLTSFMQQVNRLRALEGELGRTIQALDGVEAARVHLVMPEREAFTRERTEPSASIVVRMRGNAALDRGQANAIRSLVAASVPKLSRGQVTVLDARGNRLFDEETDGVSMAANAGRKAEVEMGIIRAVENMLAPRVGMNNVRVQAAVEFDMNRERVREQTFDPAATAVRSTQSVEELEQSNEATNELPTTVEQNLPEVEVDGDALGQNESRSERLEEVTNYEISSRVFERVAEPGALKRLSVAVMVNGTYVTNEAGERSYVPRAPQELEQLENLVRSAVGYDAARGDKVTVENLEFVDVAADMPALPEPTVVDVLRENMMTIIQWIILLAGVALVLILAVRPLVKMAAGGQVSGVPALAGNASAAGAAVTDENGERLERTGAEGGEGGDTPELSDQSPSGDPARALPKPNADEALEQMMELRAVEGKVRASSLRKLGQIVQDHPDEVVAILRTWLYEEAA